MHLLTLDPDELYGKGANQLIRLFMTCNLASYRCCSRATTPVTAIAEHDDKHPAESLTCRFGRRVWAADATSQYRQQWR